MLPGVEGVYALETNGLKLTVVYLPETEYVHNLFKLFFSTRKILLRTNWLKFGLVNFNVSVTKELK